MSWVYNAPYQLIAEIRETLFRLEIEIPRSRLSNAPACLMPPPVYCHSDIDSEVWCFIHNLYPVPCRKPFQKNLYTDIMLSLIRRNLYAESTSKRWWRNDRFIEKINIPEDLKKEKSKKQLFLIKRRKNCFSLSSVNWHVMA